MTRAEFLEAAKAGKIDPGAFSLGAAADECYVLLDEGGGRWAVFYSERGLESGKRYFASEGDALAYLLNELAADGSAHGR